MNPTVFINIDISYKIISKGTINIEKNYWRKYINEHSISIGTFNSSKISTVCIHIYLNSNQTYHLLPAIQIPQEEFVARQARFTCPRCGHGYLRKSSLWRHLNYECGQEAGFQCPHCPQRTKHKSNLQKHIKRKHPDADCEVQPR